MPLEDVCLTVSHTVGKSPDGSEADGVTHVKWRSNKIVLRRRGHLSSFLHDSLHRCRTEVDLGAGARRCGRHGDGLQRVAMTRYRNITSTIPHGDPFISANGPLSSLIFGPTLAAGTSSKMPPRLPFRGPVFPAGPSRLSLSRRHASTGRSLPRRILSTTLFVGGTALFLAYYYDSRSIMHEHVAMPVLRYVTDPETGHKLAVRLLALPRWARPRDRGVDGPELGAEVRLSEALWRPASVLWTREQDTVQSPR